MKVEKDIDEIRRMRRPRKQNEDAAKSKKVEDGIGNVGRGRRIWMTGSQNIEVDGESLRSLDVAGETSAENAERSREVECRRRQRRGREKDSGHRIS
jgi:hypothetical protein